MSWTKSVAQEVVEGTPVRSFTYIMLILRLFLSVGGGGPVPLKGLSGANWNQLGESPRSACPVRLQDACAIQLLGPYTSPGALFTLSSISCLPYCVAYDPDTPCLC